MRKVDGIIALSLVAALGANAASMAGTGVFESYIVVNGTFYDMQANTGNPDFHERDFGTFLATGTLTASGGELKTFKNNGGDVTGAQLNYRAYISGSPSFTSINLPFSANLGNGDQSWRTTSGTGNVISNRFSVGDYVYEAYGVAFTNEGDRFSSNNGANYKASFKIRATDFTWSSTPSDGVLGAAGDGATSSNWVGGTRPGQGHNLFFGSSSVTNLTNGFTAANSITFNAGASAYTIGGSTLNLGNAAAYASASGGPAVGVFNNSSNAQTINANLTLTNAATLDAASGSLAVGNVATGLNNLTLTGASDLSAVAITGGGNVQKTGAGTATLSGASNYAGTTTVSNGTLSLATTAALSGTPSVSVAPGATLVVDGSLSSTVTVDGTLRGNGSITGSTTVNGTLSPGASAGKLTINSGNLTLGDNALTNMEIDGAARGIAGGYDAVDVGGTLAYDGALALDVGTTLAPGSSFDLFNFTGNTGQLDSVSFAGLLSGAFLHQGSNVWTKSVDGVLYTFTGSSGVLSLSAEAVPEPLTAAGVMMLAGRVLGRRSRVSL